uniref:Uncharacterized protein n=1 Tax=Ditylenchus dipsaci TaxID=166011 RepID=A0A915DSU0_9BILA
MSSTNLPETASVGLKKQILLTRKELILPVKVDLSSLTRMRSALDRVKDFLPKMAEANLLLSENKEDTESIAQIESVSQEDSDSESDSSSTSEDASCSSSDDHENNELESNDASIRNQTSTGKYAGPTKAKAHINTQPIVQFDVHLVPDTSETSDAVDIDKIKPQSNIPNDKTKILIEEVFKN